ncbi:MarR family winged helix-turn-helix transcriptional regulator [Levilactobacillus acidifarinae]|uniref:HTH marR-type domain-containing protein n=1 Tax=Levilactobacillus acidifarinae DSM 19394 = JCM 15949 TaxID=1423715 RepID=A0A0R1LUH5_9LACO|nr:MarR family transcriptional regulator [Levilactobacillus acidifarinae]KRK95906.1 hypothetical protein FD25_GL002366 [Levilactobacillus acidifarinae DSM 19394]GEO69207.1 hypothetical protein LAC03_11170 [Levilactobacillus acidifarinae]
MTQPENTQISHLMRQIMRKKQQLIHQHLKPFGEITAHQIMALSYINQHPGAIQQDLVTLTQRRAPTVSVMLKRFERDNLIVRKIPSDNNRNKEITLTEHGQEIVRSFQQATTATDELAIADFTPTQTAQLIALLTQMNQHLDV